MVYYEVMTEKSDVITRIVALAARYPSPHNSQPIKVKQTSDLTASVYYDLDLGLPAENYGIPFGHVCVGVFLESFHTAAASLGYRVTEQLFDGDMDFTNTQRLHHVANITLVSDESIDHARAAARAQALHDRQTSRRPYQARPIDTVIIEEAKQIAVRSNQTFHVTTDKKMIHSIIRVNQETLFDDLQNDAVYDEIMHWLRFSKREAREKRDGLSAETMMMPGGILKFAMRHRGLWSMPVIGALFRAVYLRTMTGVQQLGWLEGRFDQTLDYIESGRCFMKIWLHFTEHSVYLHPFGTVITNPRSHKKFVEVAGITENDASMAWMLFRFGYSKQPPKAWHREHDTILVEKEW